MLGRLVKLWQHSDLQDLRDGACKGLDSTIAPKRLVFELLMLLVCTDHYRNFLGAPCIRIEAVKVARCGF